MSSILNDLLKSANSLDAEPTVRAKVQEMLYEAYADGMGDGYIIAQDDAA